MHNILLSDVTSDSTFFSKPGNFRYCRRNGYDKTIRNMIYKNKNHIRSEAHVYTVLCIGCDKNHVGVTSRSVKIHISNSRNSDNRNVLVSHTHTCAHTHAHTHTIVTLTTIIHCRINKIHNYAFHHHHHHVVLVALISLTLSRHFSLSFIASGRSSGQHLVSSHSC